ncbi:hypothetical protein M2T82_00795 [Elizabethkingia ursingii]|uniref:hypothetical protein n=1 Tax=Elizabethkingia ursingii TaxID=1756150 RepID=UPI0020112122|nr:hypothetical protein [Elizabethkingia ursingii]MCL1666591.1 hypothetical protein [Elizabethkingia ursingii]
MKHIIAKPKFVIAGGDGAGDNPLLKQIVEDQGGKMFTSSWGGGDSEILAYLKQGYSEGKQIKIYGYSRGGNAAVRVTNELCKEGIQVYELTTYDPHSLTNGYHKINYDNVKNLNNYYQQNSTDLSNALILNWPENPFWGRPIFGAKSANVNQINLSGKYYRGSLINHNNIISYVNGK